MDILTKKFISPKDMLLPYQRKFVDDQSRFKVGVFSRQTGKSLSTAEEVVEDCFTDPETMWVTGSAGERQALEWHGKAKDWSACYKLAIEDYAEDRESSEALLRKAEILFGNGSRCIIVPANPSTIRGYSCNVVLDEFDYHEDQSAIWRAIYPSITNPLGGSLLTRFQALRKGNKIQNKKRKMRVVSTYNGKRKLHDLITGKKNKKRWSQHIVTIYDAVGQGLPLDIDELREGLDDPEGWAQEYECKPLDSSNVLLPYDLIAMAESAEASEFNTITTSSDKRIVLGIDFGRQHDPSVSWMLEEVGDILWTREVLVLDKMDTPNQQDILRSRIQLAERVSFDYTGPGIGLGDYLVKEFGEWNPVKHLFGKIELCTFTQKLKRDMFPKFRRAFEAPTRIRVPISRAVREDLHSMQQVVRNGQYDYWAPRTKEGHSDRCTAGALAVRAAGDGDTGCGIYTRKSLQEQAA